MIDQLEPRRSNVGKVKFMEHDMSPGKSPNMNVAILSTSVALLMLAVCFFTAFGRPSPTLGILTVVGTLFVIAAAITQWVIYGREYVEYRIHQQHSRPAPPERCPECGTARAASRTEG